MHAQSVSREGLITVVGNLPELSPGEYLSLQGHWDNHLKNGSQFEAEVCEQTLPATVARNTGVSSTPSISFQLLFQVLSRSGMFTSGLNDLSIILKDVSRRIDFEITLNDSWQVCGEATSRLYQAFSDLEKNCVPN